jgi:nitrite reductase/ring-hydroxylating ferredoxin subunit
MPDWKPAGDAPAPGAMRLFKSDRHRVLVGRLVDGSLFAVDNACPHEGYPLAKGDVAGCVLTCRWHNFRFDVRDGKALLGDEAVRTYPVRETADGVEVDLTDPDPAVQIAAHAAAFDAAVLDGRHGQCAREAARLVQLGVSGRELLLRLARLDARHAEYGSTHVMAVATDVIGLLPPSTADRADAERAVLLVQQVVDLAIRSVIRRPARPVPAVPADVPGPELAAALVAASQAEDVPGAEALARRLAAERPHEVFDALLAVCGSHFLGFGHGLIYTQKLRELDALGDPDLVGALVVGLTNQTREDMLPEWAPWRAWVGGLDVAALAALPELRRGPDDLIEVIATQRSPYAAVGAALRAGRRQDLLDAVTIAAVERVRRFDAAHDADPTLQNGWLDVTHCLTFVDALRVAARPDTAVGLRLLLQALEFAHRHRTLDRADASLPAAVRGELAAAAAARDADRAEAIAAGLSTEAVVDAVIAAALSDDHPEPIVVAHLIKTPLAAARIAASLPAAFADRPRRALARLAASRVEQRFTRRRVGDAMRFVFDGKVPRSLT